MARTTGQKAIDKRTRGPLKKPRNRGEVKKYQSRTKQCFWAVRKNFEQSCYNHRAATRKEAAEKFQVKLARMKKQKEPEPEWVHKRRGKKYLVLYQGQQGRKYKVGDKVAFYQLKGMIKQQLGRADIGIRQRLCKTTRLRPVVAYVNKRRADGLFGISWEKAVKQEEKRKKKEKKEKKEEEEWQAFLAQAERDDEEESSDSEEDADESSDESSEDEGNIHIQFKGECVARPMDKTLWLSNRKLAPTKLLSIARRGFMNILCNRRVFKDHAKTVKQRRRVVRTLWDGMTETQKVRWAYVRPNP